MRAKNAISSPISARTGLPNAAQHRGSTQDILVSRQGYKNRTDEKMLFLKGYQNSHD
jgi:hypothetical protein